eukprot:scaffold44525_cov63-Phaeocystis_antarctica.AAC.2
MATMGFTVEHQLSLLSAVAAVLNLSNLSFSGGDGSTNRARGGGDGKACTVAPAARGALTKAARLLACRNTRPIWPTIAAQPTD